MAGGAFLVALFALLTWRPSAPGSRRIWMLVVAALALPAAWAAQAPGAAVLPPALALLAVAAGIGAASLLRDESYGPRVAAVLALCGSLVAIHALYQRLWGFRALAEAVLADPSVPDREAVLIRLEQGRTFAAFSTPAGLGAFLLLAAPVTLALAWGARGARRWFWIGALTIQVGAFLSAASATATAALIGAMILAGLAWKGGRKAVVAGLLAGFVLLSAVVALRGPEVLGSDHPNSPWRLRAGNVRAAWSMTLDNPWSGVGPGGFAEAYPAYRQAGDNETRHVHNLPLEMTAELGIPVGSLVSLFFFWLFLVPLFRRTEEAPLWRKAMALGLAAFALQNLADFTALMPSLLWTAALLRGLLAREEEGGSPAPAGSGARAVNGAALAVVVSAALIGAGAGFAANARQASREALHRGQTDLAVELAERSARVAPWDPESALASALAAWSRGYQGGDKAAEERRLLVLADRAVRRSPVRSSARALRARIRMMAGDFPGAYADLVLAARLYPGNADYARERASLEERIRPLVERNEAAP